MCKDEIYLKKCGPENDPFITDSVKCWLRLMVDIMDREAECSFADQHTALSAAHSLQLERWSDDRL